MDKHEHGQSDSEKALVEGDEKMEMFLQRAYKALDFSKFKFSDKLITTKESLREIIPIDWNAKESNCERIISISKDNTDGID